MPENISVNRSKSTNLISGRCLVWHRCDFSNGKAFIFLEAKYLSFILMSPFAFLSEAQAATNSFLFHSGTSVPFSKVQASSPPSPQTLSSMASNPRTRPEDKEVNAELHKWTLRQIRELYAEAGNTDVAQVASRVLNRIEF